MSPEEMAEQIVRERAGVETRPLSEWNQELVQRITEAIQEGMSMCAASPWRPISERPPDGPTLIIQDEDCVQHFAYRAGDGIYGLHEKDLLYSYRCHNPDYDMPIVGWCIIEDARKTIAPQGAAQIVSH